MGSLIGFDCRQERLSAEFCPELRQPCGLLVMAPPDVPVRHDCGLMTGTRSAEGIMAGGHCDNALAQVAHNDPKRHLYHLNVMPKGGPCSTTSKAFLPNR